MIQQSSAILDKVQERKKELCKLYIDWLIAKYYKATYK